MKCILQPSLYVKAVAHCVWMQAQARFCVRSCLPFHPEVPANCCFLTFHSFSVLHGDGEAGFWKHSGKSVTSRCAVNARNPVENTNTINHVKWDIREEPACRYTARELASCKIGTWEKSWKRRNSSFSCSHLFIKKQSGVVRMQNSTEGWKIMAAASRLLPGPSAECLARQCNRAAQHHKAQHGSAQLSTALLSVSTAVARHSTAHL